MAFSGLETILIGGMSAVVSTMGTVFAMSRIFVTRKECIMRHEKGDLCDGHFRAELKEIKQGQLTQFRMLRGIIAHMDMAKEKREELLNAG